MDLSRYLAEQEFFSGLPPQYLALFVESARTLELAPEATLVSHGKPAQSFYIVCEGRIRREIPSLLGPALVMHSIGPGEVLGWAWLIPPHRWAFMARADEPTRVIEFDGRSILDRCDADPRFGYEVLKRFSRLMSDRLVRARQQMMAEWNPPGMA